jgi:hypothetical protein
MLVDKMGGRPCHYQALNKVTIILLDDTCQRCFPTKHPLGSIREIGLGADLDVELVDDFRNERMFFLAGFC